MADLGKILVGLGLTLVGVGLILFFAGKILAIGRLPGDILIKKENFTFYFPVTTSLLVSLILSVLFLIFNRR